MSEVIVGDFRCGIHGWSNSSRISVQLVGGYKSIPLELDRLYEIRILMEGMEEVVLTGFYEGYWFNAEVSEGVSGVTNNSIQFKEVRR